jgi:hypothetical protein
LAGSRVDLAARLVELVSSQGLGPEKEVVQRVRVIQVAVRISRPLDVQLERT